MVVVNDHPAGGVAVRSDQSAQVVSDVDHACAGVQSEGGSDHGCVERPAVEV